MQVKQRRYDAMDLVASIYRRLQHGGYTGTPLHSIYRDEVFCLAVYCLSLFYIGKYPVGILEYLSLSGCALRDAAHAWDVLI